MGMTRTRYEQICNKGKSFKRRLIGNITMYLLIRSKGPRGLNANFYKFLDMK